MGDAKKISQRQARCGRLQSWGRTENLAPLTCHSPAVLFSEGEAGDACKACKWALGRNRAKEPFPKTQISANLRRGHSDPNHE